MEKEQLREIFLTEKMEWAARAKADIRMAIEDFMDKKNISKEDLSYVMGIPSYEMDKIFNGDGNISLNTLVALVMGSGNVIQIMPYKSQNNVKYKFMDALEEVDEENESTEEDNEEDYSDWTRSEVVSEIEDRGLEEYCDIDEDCTDDLREVLINDDNEIKDEDSDYDEDNEENIEEENEKTDAESLLSSVGKFLDENPKLKESLKKIFLE